MIGCIGYGFVGSALCNTFSSVCEILVYDINDISDKIGKNIKSIPDFKNFVTCLETESKVPVYFVCVPTPMLKNERKCDTRIIDSVLKNLFNTVSKRSIVVIKSTIPLGKTDIYNNDYNSKLDVVFNPEFLTQNNALEDFRNQTRAIIGTVSSVENRQPIIDLYTKSIPNIEIHVCSPKEAEMTKLMLNNYWAVKVAFANEMYDICKAADIDYDSVSGLVKGDPRMGPTHLSVPGPDGLRGFGGVCLPKDLNNLKTYANELGVQTLILDAAWGKNIQVRESKDWESLIGKAVSE